MGRFYAPMVVVVVPQTYMSIHITGLCTKTFIVLDDDREIKIKITFENPPNSPFFHWTGSRGWPGAWDLVCGCARPGALSQPWPPGRSQAFPDPDDGQLRTPKACEGPPFLESRWVGRVTASRDRGHS